MKMIFRIKFGFRMDERKIPYKYRKNKRKMTFEKSSFVILSFAFV